MRRLTLWSGLAAGILCGPGDAEAERPCLTVEFEVNDPRFAEMMAAPDLERLAEEGKASLVTALTCQVPFVDFAPGGSCAGPVLRVRVERNQAASRPRETWIRVTTEGVAAEPVFWPLFENVFKPGISWEREDLLAELEQAFYCENDTPRCPKYDALIREQLSQIAVAAGGEFVKNPIFVGWKLPIREDEHCVTFGTVFEVDNKLHAGDVDATFRMAGLANDPQSADENALQCEVSAERDRTKLESAEQVTVGSIFVKQLERPSLCRARTFPQDIAQCREEAER